MPRYSDQPYGLKPEQRAQFPANAQPISTAPNGDRASRSAVYERDGKRHAALYHRGQWMKVVRYPRDPHTGQARVAMDGDRHIAILSLGASANGDISQRYSCDPAERCHGHQWLEEASQNDLSTTGNILSRG